ncbi:MAG: outer membrane beta-barrel protein [Bacteroidales bacterium]|nr:outer membrane beta-barrel protein [Bacteroidales bacterium]
MKNIKINVLILSLVFCSFLANAQQQSLTIDASQMVSTFNFIDSENNKQNVDYEGVLTGAYGVGYRYILNESIIFRGGLGKNNGGANYVYDAMNYSWRLEYINAKLGFGYMLNLGRFSPYLVASGYAGYLVRGIQVLNNEEFNITESGILNKLDIGIIINPGVNLKLSDYISAFVEFNYAHGLNNIEFDASQKAQNVGYGCTLGLSFSITK